MNRRELLPWLLPLLLLFFGSWIFDYLQADLLVADALYALQGSHWSFKQSWLLEDIVHQGGRILVAVLISGSLGALASTWFSQRMRAHRQGLAFLCSTVILALLLVSALKGLTHIDCPWSFQRYGGERAYAPIFQLIFGNGNGRCFPSGHASGGYAWITLYFYCLLYKPQWRFAGLAFGLLLGLTFGLAQQLRGAHFVSHDIWTLAICWYTGLVGYTLQCRRIARLGAWPPAGNCLRITTS